jgi:hypothetical protein
MNPSNHNNNLNQSFGHQNRVRSRRPFNEPIPMMTQHKFYKDNNREYEIGERNYASNSALRGNGMNYEFPKEGFSYGPCSSNPQTIYISTPDNSPIFVFTQPVILEASPLFSINEISTHF